MIKMQSQVKENDCLRRNLHHA